MEADANRNTYPLHGLERRMVDDPAEDVAADGDGVISQVADVVGKGSVALGWGWEREESVLV